jgi:hypothetical protein
MLAAAMSAWSLRTFPQIKISCNWPTIAYSYLLIYFCSAQDSWSRLGEKLPSKFQLKLQDKGQSKVFVGRQDTKHFMYSWCREAHTWHAFKCRTSRQHQNLQVEPSECPEPCLLVPFHWQGLQPEESFTNLITKCSLYAKLGRRIPTFQSLPYTSLHNKIQILTDMVT